VLLLLGAATAAALPAAAQGRSADRPDALTAFRPRQGAGYAPFAPTPVPEALEEDPELGPGIRVNGPGELDPAGEDDLIEVRVDRALRGASLVLERSSPALFLWTTPDRQPGSELPFTADRTAPLAFGSSSSLTVWVEWTAPAHGLARLDCRALETGGVLDRLVFHTFRGLVLALGGEGQGPGQPVDPNHGTFLVASELYRQGRDVRMYDEDAVASDGSGAVYVEAVNAIQARGVAELAIFGYSHGAGSTHDLCERLDANRAGVGVFSIPFTSYVDGVENDSDVDVDMELRKPPGSAYHANHYQRGTFADFFLDGGPVPVSAPPPSGLDVETTAWGGGATHFVVDDLAQVRDFIGLNLETRVLR
jgi:hypothetical protein